MCLHAFAFRLSLKTVSGQTWLVFEFVCNCCCSSDRPTDLTPIRYDLVLPQVLLMLVITLSYSVISPVMLIFGLCYFGNAFMVWKYQVLYVYGREWEAGGVWWPQIFNRCIGAVVMFQV